MTVKLFAVIQCDGVNHAFERLQRPDHYPGNILCFEVGDLADDDGWFSAQPQPAVCFFDLCRLWCPSRNHRYAPFYRQGPGALRYQSDPALSFRPCAAAVFSAVGFGNDTQMGIKAAAVFAVFDKVTVNGTVMQPDAFVLGEVGAELLGAVLSGNQSVNVSV